MTTYKCFLIDDEPPAIDLLKNYIGMVEQLEIVGTSYSAVKAFSQLQKQPVDLIFLDIQMPVLNGIDFLKTLQNPPAVILTTAYREYALDGYDLDIIDYLLKPIAFDRFLKAVDRFRNRIMAVQAPTTAPSANEYILLNVNKTHHKTPLKDILYIESLKDYVRVHTVKEALVVKGNIGSMMKRLPAEAFVRVHRSFAVAVAHVEAYNQSGVKVNGQELPIGVSFREGVMGRLRG